MMKHMMRFVDIHYHADPDLYHRKYHAIEAGRMYQSSGGGVVLKSHLGATAVQATLAQREGYPVFPSIVLNKIAGGIHYRPILQALSEYHPVFPSNLIVHFPTHTGRKTVSKLSRTMRTPEYQDHLFAGETIFDDNQHIKPEVIDILKCAKDYPIVVSTGHASKPEVYALAEACDRLNVPCLLLNQPANPMTGLYGDELLQLTIQYSFIWTEQTALTYALGYQSKEDFYEVLNKVPRLIYSSDFGQADQMDIEGWLTISTAWFREAGLLPERRKQICLENPLHILGIGC